MHSPNNVAEFQRLLEKRDLAAYRSVATISVIIGFWESQEYDAALIELQRAKTDFDLAEARVNALRKVPTSISDKAVQKNYNPMKRNE